MEIFSETVSLRVGTLVYFTNKKEKDVTSKTEGIITAVRHDAGTCDIRVCEKEVRCELPRWEDYLHVLSSSQYTPQTALNCVCTWCRIFGLETFDEAVENVRFSAMPEELKEEFMERLNRTRKFICVTYAGRF